MAYKLPEPITKQQEGIERFRLNYYLQLGKYFSNIRVYKFIPRKIKALLIDWLIILDFVKKRKFQAKLGLSDDIFGDWNDDIEFDLSEIIVDYSFLITPAFKAYEGFLYHLLIVFKIPTEKFKKNFKNIGFFFNLDEQYNQNKEVLNLIKEKMPDKEGVERWKELYGVLERYRHHPAHYHGGGLSTIEQAERYGQTLISAI